MKPAFWTAFLYRAPDKVRKINFNQLYLCYFLTKSYVWPLVRIVSTNPMFDHLLELSQWDDSNKWLNIGFGEKIGIIETKICSLSGALNNCVAHHISALLYISETSKWWHYTPVCSERIDGRYCSFRVISCPVALFLRIIMSSRKTWQAEWLQDRAMRLLPTSCSNELWAKVESSIKKITKKDGLDLRLLIWATTEEPLG